MKRRTESETGFQILIITTEGNFYQFDKKCLLSFQQNITFEDSNDLILAADIFDNVIVALSCHAVYCGLLNKSSLIPLQNIIRLINRSTTRQID